jgi:cytochrome c oxidase subunit II
MHGTEKKVLYVSLTLMLLFAALLAYASKGLGITLPTCNDRVIPFNESKIIPKENNQFEVHYVARMWSFEPSELILPENAEADLYFSAVDVQHGVVVPGTNLNLMVVPGSVNFAHYRFDKKGEYSVICHEYCGLNHHNMMSKIKVLPAAEYAQKMQELSAKTFSAAEKLLEDKQCTSCHTTDGSEGLGPTLKGIYGSRRTLTDGTQITADEKYLIESIRDPDKHIVQGFEPGSMPPPDEPLTDQEINEIISYIKSLK